MKSILIVLFIAFSSMSFIKPGQLKKIARCSISIDSYDIYPGNILDLVLTTKLVDSTVIRSSSSNFAINYADYEIELTGGIEILEKTRTKLLVKISDTAFMDPYISINVKLRKKNSIKWQITLPILYNQKQTVSFIGKDGYDPRANSNNGYKKIPVTKRINLEFIDNQQTLTNNSDPAIIGEKGPDLDLYVSLLPTKNGNFIKIKIRDEFGEQYIKYLKAGTGSIEIQTIGGKGGISKNGGKGGPGGNVTVFITPEAKPYFDQIFIDNQGGEGGDLWRPKVDGQKQGAYGDNGEVTTVKWDEK